MAGAAAGQMICCGNGKRGNQWLKENRIESSIWREIQREDPDGDGERNGHEMLSG